MIFLLFIVNVYFNPTSVVASASDLTEQLCASETFTPKCDPRHQLILMTSAKYGRMGRSRCAQSGSFGCHADALTVLDESCSGRAECSFLVPLLASHYQPCPIDYQSYLEATYRCVQALTFDTCDDTNVLTKESGYFPATQLLPSSATDTSGRVCPVKIDVGAGNYVQIDVFDFRDRTKNDLCQFRLQIIEAGVAERINVCSNPYTRKRIVYTSKSHSIQLKIIDQSQTENRDELSKFLIYFQAHGCGRYYSPPYSNTTYTGSQLTVWCLHNTNHWSLVCKEKTWQQTASKSTTSCPAPARPSSTVPKQNGNQDSWNSWDMFGNSEITEIGVILFVVFGLLVGMMCGCCSLFACYCCFKYGRRYRAMRMRRQSRLLSSRDSGSCHYCDLRSKSYSTTGSTRSERYHLPAELRQPLYDSNQSGRSSRDPQYELRPLDRRPSRDDAITGDVINDRLMTEIQQSVQGQRAQAEREVGAYSAGNLVAESESGVPSLVYHQRIKPSRDVVPQDSQYQQLQQRPQPEPPRDVTEQQLDIDKQQQCQQQQQQPTHRLEQHLLEQQHTVQPQQQEPLIRPTEHSDSGSESDEPIYEAPSHLSDVSTYYEPPVYFQLEKDSTNA